MNNIGVSSELTCRLCCEFVAEYSAVQITLDFLAQFMDITNYQLSNSPQMSQVLCQSCDIKFRDFYTYRQHLIQSQHNLNRLIVPKVRIKVEPLQFSEFQPLPLSHLKLFDEVPLGNLERELINIPVKVELNYDEFESGFDTNIFVSNLPQSSSHFDDDDDNYELPKEKSSTKRKRRTKEEMDLIRHLSNRYKRNYHCDHCGKTAYRKVHLQKHILARHSLASLLKLPKNPQNKPIVQCNICNRFIQQEYLKRHQRRYHGIKFKREKKEPKEHDPNAPKKERKKQKYNPGPKLLCDLCGMELSNRHWLKMHILNIHMPEKKEMKSFQCEVCGKDNFKSKRVLRDHVLSVHEIGEFKCKLCDHVATTKTGYKNHFKIRHAKTKHCEICDQWFSPKMFGRHMETKNHNFSFRCSVEGCNSAFVTNQGLDLHIRFYHNKATPENSAQCPICKRFYPSEQNVARHMARTHNDEQLSCPIEGCTYRGKRKEYLRVHLLRHKELDDDERKRILENAVPDRRRTSTRNNVHFLDKK